MFHAETVEHIRTHVLYKTIFFFENVSYCEIMWKKNFTAGQTTDINMAHAHCMLDN